MARSINAACFVLIILMGLNLVLFLYVGEIMNEFNLALTRLQASVTKAIAKIDALNAGNDTALSQAATQLNVVSDSLDAKSA